MLTPHQKTLVQASFATIAPIADDAAALFYRRLFTVYGILATTMKDAARQALAAA